VILWLVLGAVIGSLAIATAGRHLRFGFWGYLFASLLLTPIIGLLLLFAGLPTREQRRVLKQARAVKTDPRLKAAGARR
jgi:hypothetical protein